jgi:hypothetical protein
MLLKGLKSLISEAEGAILHNLNVNSRKGQCNNELDEYGNVISVEYCMRKYRYYMEL